MKYKYIFGPVPSRRLGISLGVDLVPYKTCSLNCVYCECGKTNNLTLKRKEYIKIKYIIAELDDFLSKNTKIDYITFSGSGEPTLNTGLEKLIDHIRKKYPQYKLAILTNATLLNNKNVLNAVKKLDLVVPSIDSVSNKIFKKINRPYKTLNPKIVINGIKKLKKDFRGKIWLELFIIPGMNDSIKAINEFKKEVKAIKPDKVQLNTLDRPGTEKSIKAESFAKLKKISKLIGMNTEIIAVRKRPPAIKRISSQVASTIMETIKRRPCTIDDLSDITGLQLQRVGKHIGMLRKKGLIELKKQKRGIFYTLKD